MSCSGSLFQSSPVLSNKTLLWFEISPPEEKEPRARVVGGVGVGVGVGVGGVGVGVGVGVVGVGVGVVRKPTWPIHPWKKKTIYVYVLFRTICEDRETHCIIKPSYTLTLPIQWEMMTGSLSCDLSPLLWQELGFLHAYHLLLAAVFVGRTSLVACFGQKRRQWNLTMHLDPKKKRFSLWPLTWCSLHFPIDIEFSLAWHMCGGQSCRQQP